MSEPRILGFEYFGPNSDGDRWARGLVYECRHYNRKHVVEFRPVIGPPLRYDTLAGMEEQPIAPGALIWNRVDGDTPEAITLSPSIQWVCCHCVIEKGRVLP